MPDEGRRLDDVQVVLLGRGGEAVIDDERARPRPSRPGTRRAPRRSVAAWSSLTMSATSCERRRRVDLARERIARRLLGDEQLLADGEDLVADRPRARAGEPSPRSARVRPSSPPSARGRTSSRSQVACSASAALVASDATARRSVTHRRPPSAPGAARIVSRKAGRCSVDSRSISVQSRTGSVTRSRVSARNAGACSSRAAMLSSRSASGAKSRVNSGKSASPMCSAAARGAGPGRYSVNQ